MEILVNFLNVETTIKIFLLSKRGGLIRLIDSHLKGHLSVIIHACTVATISDSINIIPDLHYPKYFLTWEDPTPQTVRECRVAISCCIIVVGSLLLYLLHNTAPYSRSQLLASA